MSKKINFVKAFVICEADAALTEAEQKAVTLDFEAHRNHKSQ